MDAFIINLLREKEYVPTVVVDDNARIRFNGSNTHTGSHDPPRNRVRVRQREEEDTIGSYHISQRWSDSIPEKLDFEPMLPARCFDRPPAGKMTTTTRE
jgi:hypothetical protein